MKEGYCRIQGRSQWVNHLKRGTRGISTVLAHAWICLSVHGKASEVDADTVIDYCASPAVTH